MKKNAQKLRKIGIHGDILYDILNDLSEQGYA
jgi:hypothetical protein